MCKGKAGEIQGDWYVSIACSSTSPLPSVWNSTVNHNPFTPSQQFPVEIQKIFQYSWVWERAVNTEVSAAATEGVGLRACHIWRKQGGTGCLSKVGRLKQRGRAQDSGPIVFSRAALTDSCTHCGLHGWSIIRRAELIMFGRLNVLWLKTPKVKATN